MGWLKSQVCLCQSIEKYGCLKARLPFTAPVCSQFMGRSEHTCGPKAQQSEDSSRIRFHNLHNTCVLEGRRSNRLCNLLLGLANKPNFSYQLENILKYQYGISKCRNFDINSNIGLKWYYSYGNYILFWWYPRDRYSNWSNLTSPYYKNSTERIYRIYRFSNQNIISVLKFNTYQPFVCTYSCTVFYHKIIENWLRELISTGLNIVWHAIRLWNLYLPKSLNFDQLWSFMSNGKTYIW